MFRKHSAYLLVFGLLTALLAGQPTASATVALDASVAVRCQDPNPPNWFYPRLHAAAHANGDAVPDSWGNSRNMARIVCYESTYRPGAHNGQYYGLGQMSRTNVEAANISWRCYRDGGCAKPRSFHQLLAALRYAKARYGNPAGAWQHIQQHGWW